MTNLNELFALPINLQKVATVNDIDLYGSDSLNEKVIEAIKESSLTKPVEKEITQLIEEKRIVPVFSNSGMLKHLSAKIFPENKTHISVLAYFNTTDKKIYLAIDNNINLVGYINNNEISKLVLHELIHMISNLKPYYFLNKFKENLNIFYVELFKKLFELKDSKNVDDIIEDICKELYIETEIKREISLKKLKSKFYLLKNYSNLKGSKFDKILLDYFRIINFHFTEQYDLLFSNQYSYILKQPYLIYKDKFGFYPEDKSCVQELMIPSEIESTIAENNPNEEIYSSIKILIK
jgi:hypothetical protein